MRIEVVVPQIGEAVSELILTRWIKRVGDTVKAGDVLFEIDSDKAIVEVEAFVDGRLTEVVHGDQASVMPLQVVAYIETETAASGSAPSAPTRAEEAAPETDNIKITPVAERMALDLGIDLTGLKGSGPAGRIMMEDVRRYDAQQKTPPAPPQAQPTVSPKARLLARQRQIDLAPIMGSGVDGMIIVRDLEHQTTMAPRMNDDGVPSAAPTAPSRTRQVIAQRMTASKQQVPHFYLMAEVDMTQVQALRRYCVQTLRWDKAPTYTDILVRACALALRALPQVNRSFHEHNILTHTTINIGLAVSTDEGLVVPTLVNADRASLREVSARVRELAQRARDKRLRPADLSSKSLSISNLGMYRVDAFIAIIDMPDPMILAVGRVADHAVVVEKQIVVRPMCTLTLSVDHRVLDGAAAARFLETVVAALEAPFDILGET